MPTYEYQCEECKKTLEVFQSIIAHPLRKCPKCGGKLKRLIGTGGGIIFKGSGFYATDYRSDAYKKQASEENKPSPSSKPPSKETREKA